MKKHVYKLIKKIIENKLIIKYYEKELYNKNLSKIK